MRWYRFLCFLLMGPLAAQAESPPLTLAEAVEQALQTAPDIEASREGLGAARSLAISAGRLPDPLLTVGVEDLPVNGPDAYSTTRDFMTMRKIGVMQAFPRAEKRRLARARATAEVDLADAELTRARLEVARQTAQAWIRLATAHTSLETLQGLQADLELASASARANVAAARGSGADALAADAASARLKNRILRQDGEVRAAQVELARWVGAAADRPLAMLPALDQLPVNPEILITRAHLHGDLLPFEARLAAARTDVELARAERRPDWSAEVSFGKRGPDFSDMASLQFSIGLPLFARTRQNPVIEARGATLRQLQAERESEVRMHTAELRALLSEWQQAGAQLAQFERELLPLARERSRLTLATYRAGTGDLRSAIESFADETDLIVEHAMLQNERGRAWAELRYLEAQHVHATSEVAP
jgi:outer membrane protein TolC